MKRALLTSFAAVLLAGCATSAPTAPAGAKNAGYFECSKNGRTYVFASVPKLQKFVKTGDAGVTVSEYIGADLVTYEADGQELRLMKEYASQHK